MAKTPEEKKQKQAEAHKRWRQSPKGQAYYAKRKVAKYIAENQSMSDEPKS